MVKHTAKLQHQLKLTQKVQRLTFYLLLVSVLGGCSSIDFDKFLQPVNTEAMSSYEQAKLNCSVITGIESNKSDISLFQSSGFSLGLRLPNQTTLQDDLYYESKLEDYYECLRLAGM